MAITIGFMDSLLVAMPTKNVLKGSIKSLDVAMLCDLAIATKVEGKSSVPLADIGAPFRLRIKKATGEVQFSTSGKPSFGKSKGITEYGTMIHNNMVAGMLAYIDEVNATNAKEVEAMKEAAETAGKPLIAFDSKALAIAQQARAEAEAEAEAEAKAPETPKATAKSKHPKNPETQKAEVEAPAPERELVGASV